MTHHPHRPSDGPAPPPRLVFGLLLAYPLLTHLAVHLHSLLLTGAAALLLMVLVLRGPLQGRRAWAWLLLAAGVVLVAWLGAMGQRHDAVLALYAAPVMIHLFLAWFFGRTLRAGRQPLITRIAEHLHGEAIDDPVELDDMRRYTRRLTAVWTGLFLVLATTNATLALLVSPSGVLELAGVASPYPVSPALWSLFANFLSFGLVLLLFAIEFAFRRRRFPRQHARYRGLVDFLLHMRTAAPALLHSTSPAADAAEHDYATPAARMRLRRSWRRSTLWLLLLVHVAAVGLVIGGQWQVGIGVMVASHLLILWATLAPRSTLLGPMVTQFDAVGRDIWLTIDDGPSRDTAAMLDLLDAHGARATFFLVGARAEAHPDAVRAIQQRGHGIGNHSLDHHAAWFWALPPRAMDRQVGATQHSLTRLSGRAPRLFRAVVGMSNVFVEPVLRRHGLLHIGWSARGFDSISADPATVWGRLRPSLQPGAILLLHEGAAHGGSVATLARVLQELSRLGYRCVLPELPLPTAARSATTSQLLNGVPPHNGENVTRRPSPDNSAASTSRSG
jgi:peptidoglycan-N-acetylglucosamine deacetylase